MKGKLAELLLIEELDRRAFLKLLGLSGAVVAGGGFISRLFSYAKGETVVNPPAYAFVIDLAKCDGCQLCVYACQANHYLGTVTRDPGWKGKPKQTQWITIYEMEDPLGGKYFMPVMCQNCQKAPCVDVCPVGASFYSEFDVSIVDWERCIGCRACLAACPYQVRVFNWETPDVEGPWLEKEGRSWSHNNPQGKRDPPPTPPPPELRNGVVNDRGERMSDYSWKYDTHMKGRAEKCDFCLHNAYEGALPHCVAGCPMGALYYGDLKEDAVTNSQGETLSVSETIETRTVFRLKEELGTETRVYYIAKSRGD